MFYMYLKKQCLLPCTVILARLFITELENVSCAVRNKFICTAHFVATGLCTVACVNTKTSLYTPVESLASAFNSNKCTYIDFNNLKFTLKHIKRPYMFRLYDHPQGVLACNFSKEQSMLHQDDRMIETCRSVLNDVM